jgi:hypothetical protein
MPPVSQKQREAMWAAAKGKSTLGISAKVGKDFTAEDPGGKLPEKAKGYAKGGHVYAVSEHEDHFKVEPKETGKGQPFRVAKKDLKPAELAAYKHFCKGGQVQHYDKGGDVKPDVKAAQEKLDADNVAADKAAADELAAKNAALAANPPPVDTGPPTGLLSGASKPFRPQDNPGATLDTSGGSGVGVVTPAAPQAPPPVPNGITTPPAAPAGPVAEPHILTPDEQNAKADQAFTQQMNGLTVGAPPVPSGFIGESPAEKAARAQQAGGAQALAAAEGAAGNKAAAVLHQAQIDEKARDAEQQRVEQPLQAGLQRTSQEYAQGKINPNDYWEKKGTVGQIGNVIGILLSGFGQGFSAAGGHPTENMALGIINQKIRDNIHAQIENRDASKNSFEMFRQQLGDSRAAYAASTAHALTMVRAQLDEAGQLAVDPEAKARAAMYSGALAQQAAQEAKQAANLSIQARNQQKLAVWQTTAQSTIALRRQLAEQQARGPGLAVEHASLLNDDKEHPLVPASNGRLRQAVTPEAATEQIKDASESKDFSQRAQKVLDLDSQMSDLQRTATKLGVGKASPEIAAQIQRIQTARNAIIDGLGKGLGGSSKIGPEILKMYKETAPDPTQTGTYDTAARAGLEQLKSAFDDGLRTRERQRLLISPNYQPPK